MSHLMYHFPRSYCATIWVRDFTSDPTNVNLITHPVSYVHGMVC